MIDYDKIQDILSAREDTGEVFEADENASARFGGVDSEFFPLDYLPEDSGLDSAAVEVRAKIDLLKSYIDDVSKAESAARQDSFLAKQAYKTDLIFIVSEINGALAQWGTGGSAAVSNRRLRQLVSLLKARIEVTK